MGTNWNTGSWQWSNTKTVLKDLFLSFAQYGHFRSLSVFGFCRGIQLSIIPFKPKVPGILPERATCRTAGNKERKTELVPWCYLCSVIRARTEMLDNTCRAINVNFLWFTKATQRKNYNFLMEGLKDLCRELIVSGDIDHEHKPPPYILKFGICNVTYTEHKIAWHHAVKIGHRCFRQIYSLNHRTKQ